MTGLAARKRVGLHCNANIAILMLVLGGFCEAVIAQVSVTISPSSMIRRAMGGFSRTLFITSRPPQTRFTNIKSELTDITATVARG